MKRWLLALLLACLPSLSLGDVTGVISPLGGQANTAAIYVAAGSTDVLIQAAVNGLASRGCGTVYLAAGTFTLNNPVTLANCVSIIGSPTAFPPANHLLSNEWIPSGGTIIQAGTATQGFIWNATDQGSVSNWGANQLSGILLENLTFSGFTGASIKIGAKNAEGLVMSRLRHLAFYNCGTQGTDYETGTTYALELRNFAGINVQEIYTSKCQNGVLARMSVPSATQQIGNSTFDDIQVDTTNLGGVAANFARPLVFGSDPSITTSLMNEMRVRSLASYAFVGRSTISDTATFTGGTTFTVGTGTNYPVGMPVRFTANSGNIHANWAYFILSQSGNTLSIGTQRAGSAVTLPGSGTLTIQQTGYPLVDIGGVTPSQAVADSYFNGLDLEGPALGSVYCENCQKVAIGINQSTNSFLGLVFRSSGLMRVESMESGLTPDFDSISANTLLTGAIGPGIAFGGNGWGVIYDGTNQMQGINLAVGNTKLNAPNIFNGGGNSFIRFNAAASESQVNVSATGFTFGAFQSGYYVLEPTTSQTWILPALNNSSIFASLVSIRFKFNNTGTAAAIIQPSANTSGQLINNTAHTTNQVSLAAGQWAEFVGVLSNGGVTYWSLITTGTIS